MLSYHTCPLAILGGKDTGGMNVYVRELTRYLGQRDLIDPVSQQRDRLPAPYQGKWTVL
jgi:D-inositol-3-phosphate glycosyltransferase